MTGSAFAIRLIGSMHCLNQHASWQLDAEFPTTNSAFSSALSPCCSSEALDKIGIGRQVSHLLDFTRSNGVFKVWTLHFLTHASWKARGEAPFVNPHARLQAYAV